MPARPDSLGHRPARARLRCIRVRWGAWPATDEYAGFLGMGMANMVTSAWDASWINGVGEGMVRWLRAGEPELDDALGALA